VTDANLVLGYLSPSAFAGGTITLDAEGAAEAVRRHVAEPLGMSVEEAAWGIHTIVNTNMEHATRVVSIERGHDPRTLALVATGGSGPAHACRLAQALGMPLVIVPAAAGVASAIGMLAAEVKFDVVRTRLTRFDEPDAEPLNEMFDEMEREAEAVITESSGAPPSRTVREVELRYIGQGYELTVEVPEGRLTDDHLGRVRTEFERAYEKRYGFSSRDQQVEATTWKLTAYGATDEVRLPTITDRSGRLEDALSETRRVYFPETGGSVPTPVYTHDLLVAGAAIEGPAVIEQRESTTVVPPGVTAEVDATGSLLCQVGAIEAP
jgi:N-methylhydantoinase A